MLTGTDLVKRGMAEMQKGGVIMDVMSAEQARIAEAAGAVAVMALERIPSEIRRLGGVARTSDPQMIEEVQKAVSIPVMAKARIGHFVEAKMLESLGVDYIDESEVLTPADEVFHINKSEFTVPFVCGARSWRSIAPHWRRRFDDAYKRRARHRERRRSCSSLAYDQWSNAQIAKLVERRVDGRSEKLGSAIGLGPLCA